MRRLAIVMFVVAFPFLAGCALHSPLPLIEGPPPVPLSSSVYNGYARAFRFIDGGWIPVPGYDYEFLTFESRYAKRWDVIKEIHHRDPRYDGGAGPRDQTLYFVVHTSPASDGGLDLVVGGTLGTGKGHEKPGGAGLVIEIASAEKGWFVPFNMIRIRQDRANKNARFHEIVELFSTTERREIPFMKMEEKGIIYLPLPRSAATSR
jgi:hypothetical protein